MFVSVDDFVVCVDCVSMCCASRFVCSVSVSVGVCACLPLGHRRAYL